MRAAFRELALAMTNAALVVTLAACADSATTESARGIAPQPNPPSPRPPSPGAPSPVTEFIFVANPDGSGAVQLTAGGRPSWSPDGRRIVFRRYTTPPSPSQVYVIDADGSNERRLQPGDSPSWSPDGKHIAFADDAGVEVMDPDGSNMELLVSMDFRDDDEQALDLPLLGAVWSPDGKRIAFERSTDWYVEPERIFVMNVDGSSLHRLSRSDQGSTIEADPAWSPDGRSIAYWRSSYSIAIVDANGGVPREVFADPLTVGDGSKPAWSPDGASVAFNTAGPPVLQTRSIMLLSLRTGATQLLIPDAYNLAYAPDGKHIAYTRQR